MEKTMKKTITYQLVDTAGEISAIVLSSVTDDAMPKVAKLIMWKNKAIEQVGFLSKDTFRMMGGELSVNGMLAAEFLRTGARTIRIPRSLLLSVTNNIVTYNGMTYVLFPNPPSTKTVNSDQKKILQKLCKTNPASGIIYYKNASITPLIYVRATNTYVWEQSCGSGSVAYALFSGRKIIQQPSGSVVRISISPRTITYQATVRVIGSKEVV